MSGHLDGPPPGPPDPPYIPGDLGAPSPEEFARRRASSEPRPANPTPEERVRDAPEVIMDANGNYWRRYEDGTLSMCPTSTDNLPLAEPVVTYHPDLGVWPDQSATHGVLLDEIRELEARAIAAEDAAAAATAAERERTEEAYRLAAEYREKAREATALLRPKCLSCRGTGLQADGRYQELKCEACGGTGRTGEYDAAVQAIAAAERGRTRRALAEPRAYRLALAEYAARRERGEDRFESMRLAIGLLAADLIEKGDTDA